MADTFTVRIGARKADPTDNVDVNAHVNANSDLWDLNLGFRICTSVTRPASPWQGMMIYETDTLKTYFYDGTAYQPVLTSGGGITVTSANPWNFTRTGSTANVISVTNSTAGGQGLRVSMTAAADMALAAQQVGDSIDRWRCYGSGLQEWGPGGSTARDTNLYRGGANLLKSDDALQIGGDLTLPGGVVRTTSSASVTVANTTTETIIASMTLPANDLVVGADYRLTAWGVASVTGTPTLTLRTRYGGVAGTAYASSGARTAQSAAATRPWRVETYFTCLSTGASGSLHGQQLTYELLSVAGALPAAPAVLLDGGAPIAGDTTTSKVLALTAQWSAASSSNTLTCEGWIAERVT